MFQIAEFIISVIDINIEKPLKENKYAEVIPYEDLYPIQKKPNKNTLEYNTMTTEELIREQNEKILIEILKKEQELIDK